MNNHTYTQEQLDQMNDVDLTIAVAQKLDVSLLPDFNPLENYNDCMPIVEKYGLVVKPALIKCGVVKTWSCNDRRFRPFFNGISMLECVSIQPTIQRAIVYCFLLMEV